MNIRIAILFLMTLVFASCKMSTSPTPASDVPTAANTMYLSINGVTDTLTAYATDTTYDGASGIAIVGANATTGINYDIAIATFASTGNYAVGSVSVIPPGYVIMSCTRDSSGTAITYTSPTQPSLTTKSVGTLTVTAISKTSVQATFNGTLTLQNGAATISIANGGVNANFVD